MLICTIVEQTAADCCYPTYLNCSGQMEFACADCSTPTPFCGIDECNTLGCNCKCRTGNPSSTYYHFYNVTDE